MINRRALLAGASGLIASPALAFPVIDAAPRRLDQLIKERGEWANATLILDAGDARSYTGGQTFYDLSTGGRNFTRGAGGSASTDDPTFNGAAGNLSRKEYFSFDGGDYFRKAAANDSFCNGFHKDNAAWTACGAIYTPSSFATGVLFSTINSGTPVGVQILWLGDGRLRFSLSNGVSTSTIKDTTATMPTARWAWWALSQNEAGTSFFSVNGTVETFPGAYTSPSASAASATATIAARGDGSFPLGNGSRLGAFMMFDSALSQTTVASLRASLMARFA